jgi:16S rRNA (adenine1518-N6/adenine1519-N6)-dimethyltransferase
MELSTSQLIKKYGLDAKKSLGQNFILDANLTDKIARAAGDLNDFEVLEIGPGPAGLTRSILKYNPQKLLVVEQDARFIPLLEEIKSYNPNLEILQGDAMQIKENELFNKPFKIIANLPYNIGTLLLFKWLANYQNISSMILMLQKEVVERIVAKPGGKKFGRLSVMVNFLCDTKHLFDVSPAAFVPPPKVTSAIVKITPRAKPLMDVDLKILERICQAAFGQRRKMLRSSLKSLGINAEELLEKSQIDPTKRAEELSLEQFGVLTQNYIELSGLNRTSK